ncbi:MAG TPA: I78 family peptidase inhibitor [Lysobacter sp.]
MPLQGTVREGDWMRLVVPVVVLVASVAACSAMRPADAGTPTACRAGNADQWIGRAASAAVVEQARQASGSREVRLVMPDETTGDDLRSDRLSLYLDDGALITRSTCG